VHLCYCSCYCPHRVGEAPLAAFEDGLLTLDLVLKHSRSVAHDLYPVCQALAAQVVEGCSVVTCQSLDDLAVLLDSPRWTGHKTVTALTVSTVSPSKRPAALQDATAQVAQARQLCVWVTISSMSPDGEDADLAVLTGLAPKLPDLKFLELFLEVTLDDKHHAPWWTAKALSSSLVSALQYWPQLQHLHLARCNMGIRDAQRLFGAAACCQQLQTLKLSDNNLHCIHELNDINGAGLNESLLQSADCTYWQQLRCLLLANSALGPKCTSGLMTAAQQWKQLQILDLSSNHVYADGAQALAAAAPHWPQLQRLILRLNSMGIGGGQALVAAVQHWPQLQHLDLAYNYLKALGAQALLDAAPYMPKLQHLGLEGNHLDVKAAKALAAAAPHLKQLQHLDLRENFLGPSGVCALSSAGQHWTQLRKLDLGANKNVTRDTIVALKAAVPHWEDCVVTRSPLIVYES